MKQKRSTPRRPTPKFTAVPSPTSPHAQTRRRHPRHFCGNCRDGADLVAALLAAGVSTSHTEPPTRTYQDAKGTVVAEELSLVGTVRAPISARERLELAGIDLRYATHRPSEGRWVLCLFSNSGIDHLFDQMARGAFPYAFEANTSIGARSFKAYRAGNPAVKAVPAFWYLLTDHCGKSARGTKPPRPGKAHGIADLAHKAPDRSSIANAGGQQS